MARSGSILEGGSKDGQHLAEHLQAPGWPGSELVEDAPQLRREVPLRERFIHRGRDLKRAHPHQRVGRDTQDDADSPQARDGRHHVAPFDPPIDTRNETDPPGDLGLRETEAFPCCASHFSEGALKFFVHGNHLPRWTRGRGSRRAARRSRGG